MSYINKLGHASPPRGCGFAYAKDKPLCSVYSQYRRYITKPRTAGLNRFQWAFISLVLFDLDDLQLQKYASWMGVPWLTLKSTIYVAFQAKSNKFIGKYSYLKSQAGMKINPSSRRFLSEKPHATVEPI
jgi:hypothetical protein